MSATCDSQSEFVLPLEVPVSRLDAEQAFNDCTACEKLYAHHISRASWYGGLIVLFQTSPESPDIFRLIQLINTAESVESLKEKCVAAGVSEDEFRAYLVYCSGFYSNMGNYKGFGDSKLVPGLHKSVFEKIVEASAAAKSSPQLLTIWKKVGDRMYTLTDKEKQLGLGNKGITKYFSHNCDSSDSDIVNVYLKHKSIEGYINRVLKTIENGKTVYEIRHAAVENSQLSEEEFEGNTFRVTTGDYQELLEKVCQNMKEAIQYSANDLERNMLTEYIKSFRTGNLDNHKDGSRHWIKNKGPRVETYIGFIETYRDPAGMRGEFEGFVSIVNKKLSERLQTLVNKAEELLPSLPWPVEYEKDKFLRPDFTSIDVLTFAGSGVPAGINIPNYDEVRQSEGFKNVSLGNVISARTSHGSFVSEADFALLTKYKLPSFEMQVGLHELLGHGSGKLFMRTDTGAINYPADLTNPLTGKPVASCYGPGETYDSKFTTIGSSYEECRAECAGLHLCLVPGVAQIFGLSGEEAEHSKYINWFSMALAGVKGLEMFSPASMEWKQAHCQARFVILRVMLEAGEGFLKVEKLTGKDGKPDLIIKMDWSKVESVGAPAISKFLCQLQVFKSTGDDKAAREMYGKYSKVSCEGDHPWLSWRDIVVARKQPRNILVQGNTRLENEKLQLVQYEESPAGMVKSWSERFPDVDKLDRMLEDIIKREDPHWS